MEITPEFIITLIGGGGIVAATQAIIAWRHAPSETQKLRAEAHAAEANADRTDVDTASVWARNYNEIVDMLQKRDRDLIDVNRRVLQLESDKQAQEELLVKERERRIKAEKERDELNLQVDALTLKVKRLEVEIQDLRQTQSHYKE